MHIHDLSILLGLLFGVILLLPLKRLEDFQEDDVSR